MITVTTKLGSTASDVVVAKVAVSLTLHGELDTESLLATVFGQHGLMSMTYVFSSMPLTRATFLKHPFALQRRDALSDEQAFESIKSGIDALPEGVTMMLNSGGPEQLCVLLPRNTDYLLKAEFYGKGWTTGNLELLARFFEKNPGYADKTFLSVRVSSLPCRRLLLILTQVDRGTKKIDMFVSARVDRYTSRRQCATWSNSSKGGSSTTSGSLSAVRTRCGAVTVYGFSRSWHGLVLIFVTGLPHFRRGD